MPTEVLDEPQVDPGRKQWELDMLIATQSHFEIFGDRRDGSAEMYFTVKSYGQGMPAMGCSCGEHMAWEDWPDHWRNKHGI